MKLRPSRTGTPRHSRPHEERTRSMAHRTRGRELGRQNLSTRPFLTASTDLEAPLSPDEEKLDDDEYLPMFNDHQDLAPRATTRQKRNTANDFHVKKETSNNDSRLSQSSLGGGSRSRYAPSRNDNGDCHSHFTSHSTAGSAQPLPVSLMGEDMNATNSYEAEEDEYNPILSDVLPTSSAVDAEYSALSGLQPNIGDLDQESSIWEEQTGMGGDENQIESGVHKRKRKVHEKKKWDAETKLLFEECSLKARLQYFINLKVVDLGEMLTQHFSGINDAVHRKYCLGYAIDYIPRLMTNWKVKMAAKIQVFAPKHISVLTSADERKELVARWRDRDEQFRDATTHPVACERAKRLFDQQDAIIADTAAFCQVHKDEMDVRKLLFARIEMFATEKCDNLRPSVQHIVLARATTVAEAVPVNNAQRRRAVAAQDFLVGL
ncbi:hypothetical protein NLG97_g724 [Lecanicillium saksenae]|uniref:Uncharacterized protein n=1 Tax=Lecanicillium saksenae TaxID=468837 RepID=A0ACC1R986_9HYPO|nr:hypothetical protein NLG97_g724 [Lecanicillium saksenae]